MIRRRNDRDDIELHDVTFSSRPRDLETTVSVHSNSNIPSNQNVGENLQREILPTDLSSPVTQHPTDNINKPKELPKIFKYTSVILENKGSVARDHMANERTFLAWLRTGCVFVTLTVTFSQFVHLSKKSNSLIINKELYDLSMITSTKDKLFDNYGTTIVILGLLLSLFCSGFAMIRYFHIQSLLTNEKFPAGRIAIGFIVLINLSMLILLLIFEIKLLD